MSAKLNNSAAVVRTVFIALVLDLLAFTIPLPLFPRLIAWYLHKESHSPETLLPRLLSLSHSWRSTLLSYSGTSATGATGADTRWLWNSGRVSSSEAKNWDVVLLGGAMGSLFSICQCLISPRLGSLSDRYGRKKVLMLTMIGNIVSAVIWIQSTSFASFLLSRLVGGLSEGNVQLSTAIISDVTTTATRSKSLALVGIAFSICFTFGPSLGAYFASRPLPITTSSSEERWNIYALPAILSLVLLLIQTAYLWLRLPETKDWKKGIKEDGEGKVETPKQVKEGVDRRLKKLKVVGRIHGLFLLFFSGAEFTLTFLTYDLFAASNAANGRLLSYIGILAALLQARHVRPSLARGELKLARQGVIACITSLTLLAILPIPAIRESARFSTVVLYAAATGLAYTSATVVTSLTAAAAGCCDEDGSKEGGDERLRRGRALGGFRSKGALGRAIGPLLATSIYWLRGPILCYSTIAVLLSGICVYMGTAVREERDLKVGKKT